MKTRHRPSRASLRGITGSLAAPSLAILLAMTACPATATDLGSSSLGSTQNQPSTRAPSPADAGRGASRGGSSSLWVQGSMDESVLAQSWRITVPELRRARELMAGPRGAFSDGAISPVEVLGIHATSPGERQRYARLMATISAEDTLRVLAWFKAVREETAVVANGLPRMQQAASPTVKPTPPTRPIAMGPVANNRSPAERSAASPAGPQSAARRAP